MFSNQGVYRFDLWQQPIGNGRRYCKIQYNDTGTGSYPLPVEVPSPVLLGVGARSRSRCSRHSVNVFGVGVTPRPKEPHIGNPGLCSLLSIIMLACMPKKVGITLAKTISPTVTVAKGKETHVLRVSLIKDSNASLQNRTKVAKKLHKKHAAAYNYVHSIAFVVPWLIACMEFELLYIIVWMPLRTKSWLSFAPKYLCAAGADSGVVHWVRSPS